MNVRVDNRYVYKYLEEQHQRDAARTLGVQAENKKKEIPFLLSKYGGIAVVILFIGFAIYYANSYKKILDHSLSGGSFNEGYYGMNSSIENSSEADDIIDIESLLVEELDKDHFEIENNENLSSDVIRNYVIFDRSEINEGNVLELFIGRSYENPDSDPNRLWCYVSIVGDGGIGTDFHFITVNNGERIENEITNKALNLMGISLDKAIEVKKQCNI